MVDPTAVIYSGLLMAVAVGITAWRLATAEVRIATNSVDRMLGACLVASVGLFVVSLLPGTQLP
jgi:hypothetical protein